MSVRVRLTQPRLRKIAGVQLRPGLQSLTPDEWKAVRGHPIGAANIERGVIVAVESKPQMPGGSGEPSASELTKQMSEIFDVAELTKHAEDSRSTVAKAANDQLAKIRATARKGE